MIAHLRGRVAARATGSVVVDVGGVGYLVHIPTSATGRVPPRGEPVELHTSLQVREDAMTLYGFPDRTGREVFELLLGASGVGPKLALAALSTHPAEVLRQAIADGDVDLLTAVPGIGRKSAQRLVLELRERVGGVATEDLTARSARSTPLGEVRDALVALGYTPGEASSAVAGMDADGEVATLLREALRNVAGAGAVNGIAP